MQSIQKFCGFLRNPGIFNSIRNNFSAVRTGPLALQVPSVATPHTSLLSRCMSSLLRIHRCGHRMKLRKPKTPLLDGCPQKRGVVLKVIIKKPKKPNSANRRCVRLRLSSGKEATAYVPGEGHNLQEHSVVMVQGGTLQDVPGVNLVCVRGKYDLAHVKRKTK